MPYVALALLVAFAVLKLPYTGLVLCHWLQHWAADLIEHYNVHSASGSAATDIVAAAVWALALALLASLVLSSWYCASAAFLALAILWRIMYVRMHSK